MAHLQPGTRIKVGQYSTKVIRYLSEGGFSHVYIAKLDIPIKGSDIAVLKRIIAPDKAALAAIRTEVETMKKLRGHRHIVTYFDSHATELKTGGFEVYVLMEYCAAGGLIDFMNTRLQTRLAEWEVLKIFSDTAEAVACMHYLRPALLHRDLKIENVLISSPDCYKLCDFGSCSEVRPAATNSQERRALEDDILKNTTIQYRSPEMVDVSRRLPIDEKSDIWALGVMLYKLCYFTTPFEAQGPVAILNAAYTFPPFPPYTDRTKRLIAVMLQEHPRDRPNIYQLLAEVCAMRNTKIPIPDIYSRSKRPSSQSRARPPSANQQESGNVLAREKPEASPVLPDVEPMRRGRPAREVSPVKQLPHSASAVKSTKATEPFADSVAHAFHDDFISKFPSLDELGSSLDNRAAAPSSKAQGPSLSKYEGASKAVQRASNLDATVADFKSRFSSEASNDTVPRNPVAPLAASSNSIPLQSARPPHQAHLEAGFRQRPQLINRASQTSPKQRGQHTQTSPPKAVPSGIVPSKPVISNKPAGLQSSESISRPTSRDHWATDLAHRQTGKPLPAPTGVRPRPVTVHVPSGADMRDVFAVPRPISVTSSRPASAAESRTSTSELPQDETFAHPGATKIRRSASSGQSKHVKRPSLTQIGSFSGAARTLVNGKFGDAFRKFESSGHKAKASSQQTAEPLRVQEVDDLPDHITDHLKSTSARRSLSYSRNQITTEKVQAASQREESTNVDESSYSVKEAMRRLREKASQPYEVKKTATGYGKYTDETIVRSATVIPTTRAAPRQASREQKLMHQASMRAGARSPPVEEEDFEKRYPSLTDFTV